MGAQRDRPGRTNRRAVVVTLGSLLSIAVGVACLKATEARRLRGGALRQAARLEAEGRADLAIRDLGRYLDVSPDDVGALDVLARLTADSARGAGEVLAAARVNDRLLRLDPGGPGRQETRRRLAELYIRFSDAYRNGPGSGDTPEQASHELRYRAAEGIALQMVARDGRSATARRLLGMAREGLAVPGDPAALADSVRAYEEALKLDPADAVSAGRLAALYRSRLRDPGGAERVLGALLRAGPGRVEFRLARYRHYARFREPGLAAAELREATRLDPGNVSVLLAAAGHALQRGDPGGARRQIEAVPGSARDGLNVRLLRGMIEFAEGSPEGAIGEWRAGLSAAGGTDAELTWWLACVQLQLDRVAEAKPLVSQYHRLVGGDDDPMTQFLQALLDEKSGRPRTALDSLERLGDRVGEAWRSIYYLALGRCYEAVWDVDRALSAYRQAANADPTAAPRLAVARLLADRDPDGAVAALSRDVKASPGDPSLKIALAGLLFRRQASAPPEGRAWGAFDEAWRRAFEAAPDHPSLLRMQAERRLLAADPDGAVASWRKATVVAPHDPSAWVSYAEGLGGLGRHDEAARVLESAAEPGAVGDRAAIRIARARILTAAGRGREGRSRLTLGLDRLSATDRALALKERGRLLADHGDLAGALSAFREWAGVVPESPEPRLAMFELALAGGDEATVRTAVASLRELGGPGDLTWQLCRALELAHAAPPGDFPRGAPHPGLVDALALLDGLQSDAREAPAVSLIRGGVLERLGRLDEAEAGYRRAWQRGLEPGLVRLASLLARRRKLDDLARLRRSAPGGKVDQILARSAPARGVDTPATSARRLAAAGKVGEAEAVLLKAAEASGGAEASWLDWLRFRAEHGRPDEVAGSVGRVKSRVKTATPEVLDARCLWAVGDTRGADLAFPKAAGVRPDDPDSQLAAAAYFRQTGRYAAALRYLGRARELDPGRRAVAREFALTLSETRHDGPAWELALSALGPEASGTADPEDRLARAVVISRSPDAEARRGAVGRLEGILGDLPSDHPTAFAARDALARLLLRAGSPGRACEVAAVTASRRFAPPAIALYVEALLHARDHAGAGRQLDLWHERSPGDRGEARLRARLIAEREPPERVAAALERAYLGRDDGPAADELGREVALRLFGLGPAAATVGERVARRLSGKTPGFSWVLARRALADGRRDDALRLCRAVLDAPHTPADAVEAARVGLGVANAAGADEAEIGRAGGVVELALGREPRSTDLLAMTAALRHLQGRYEEEAALYRSLLALRPGHPTALNNLAWVLSEGLGRPAEGLALADELSDRVGTRTEAPCTRGVILFRLARVSEAIGDLERVTAREPSALGSYFLALAYQKAGRAGDARRSLASARQAGFTPGALMPSQRAEYETFSTRLAGVR